MHGRQGCFLIALKELADADDDIQRRTQVVADRLQEFGAVDVVGKQELTNAAALVLWDINWLHSLYSHHES